jgi:hypothetical protein
MMNSKITYIIAFILILIAASGDSFAYDMRAYIVSGQNTFVNAYDQDVARFTFWPDGRCKQYKKSGTCLSWRKEYNKAGWVEATTGLINFGYDGSMSECGDVRPKHRDKGETIFYKRGNKYDCLPFAGYGGITEAWTNRAMQVQGTSDAKKDQRVFMMSRLVEFLPTYTLDGGNRQTYHNVIHFIALHGSTEKFMARCKRQLRAGPVAYSKKKGYNINAMEYWAAEGVGIIKKDTPYVENEPGHRGNKQCFGYMFDNVNRAMYLK